MRAPLLDRSRFPSLHGSCSLLSPAPLPLLVLPTTLHLSWTSGASPTPPCASMRPSLCSSVAWTLFLVIPCSIAIVEGPPSIVRFLLGCMDCSRRPFIFHRGVAAAPRASMRRSLCSSLPVSCAFVAPFPPNCMPIAHANSLPFFPCRGRRSEWGRWRR